MKLILIDVDGTRYYINARGDILNKHGDLVPLAVESNVRNMLTTLKTILAAPGGAQ